MSKITELVQKVIAGDWKDIARLTQAAVDSGMKTEDIVHQLQGGMEVVGQKYSSGEYFLPNMMKSARCMTIAFDVLKSAMKGIKIDSLGKIIIGTVKSDMHDIGKNIVVSFLKGVGFEVIDLGTDVSEEKFCEAIKREKPEIVGLSSLLTTTMYEIGVVIKKLEETGLRSSVKVIAGGAPVTEDFAKRMGADAYASDGGQAVAICKRLMQA